jgi:hypothetical protein
MFLQTDQRSKLLQELLGAMRIIKVRGELDPPLSILVKRLKPFLQYFVFEKPYSERIDKLRQSELRGIRSASSNPSVVSSEAI